MARFSCAAAALFLALATACASTAPPAADAMNAGPPPDPAFAPALDRAAAGGWDYLRIDAGCRAEPAGWRSTVLFGSGVGIVDERRQFAVPRQRLLDLLARFQEIGFATLPALVGGGEEGGEGPATAIEGEGGVAPLQAVCVLTLRVDGIGRAVQQLDRGVRNEALLGLAEEILAFGESAAAGGVGADSLGDGLAKLESGELAPEALVLTVNHRDPAGDGWLLVVDGGFAWVQRLTEGAGYGPQHRLALDAATIRSLAAALRRHDFGSLPGNLYDRGYLDVRLDLLGHQHEVLAQGFAGMTASTHATAQERLAAVAAPLRALAERVLDAG